MEDLVTASADTLLPDGVETTFAQIESTLAGLASNGPRGTANGRSLAKVATATVVAIGPRARLVEAAAALKTHADAGGIRAILVAVGDRPSPAVRVTASEIALDGLRAEFVDNALAALRLPSLPAVLWWRGGEPGHVEHAAPLADRLVLDAEDPLPLWSRIDALAEHVPVSDLRWTALTRWRALLANFFDLPGVTEAAPGFTRLEIAGADAAAARLLAGWLRASVKPAAAQVRVEERGGADIDSIVFGNDRDELRLRRLPNGPCVEARARIEGREASRIVSIGNRTLAALIGEELRIRSRDLAFEAAVRAAGAIV